MLNVSKKNFCFSLMLFFSLTLSSQIRINEFMQSNINCIMDDLNDFPDSWIELYNTSDSDININGWYISEKGNYSKGWKINADTIIPAKGYLLLYCDKVGSGLHADFRMETTKTSNLYLFDKGGKQIDAVTNIPPHPNPNISRGLDENGEWQYFIEATPGKENTTPTARELTPEPIFKTKAGVYFTSLDIEIENNSGIEQSAIYYTIDGSEPTKDSFVYSESIHIDTTTVIKAKIIADNYLIPWSTTNSYIITDREFSLPVISLSLDDTYLWDDEIGIYVAGINGLPGRCVEDAPEYANYRNNWRRPMVVEYFPNQESESVINQLGELRIMGGCSRDNPLKSFAIYSNKRFGKKHFDYPVFQNEDKKDVIIKSFLLRNSGNDFYGMYFNDAFIHSLIAGKIDLEYQAYQPTIAFVNGHYWGILNLRERSNEDHVYGNYEGLEDIDMIENWSELKVGDKDDFNFLMNGLNNDTFSYEDLENLVDIEEFMNLFILEIFVSNFDFPENNIVMWKKKENGAKWRFILKDTDTGLTGIYLNALDHFLNYEDENYATLRARLLFRKLMSEKQFEKKFLIHFTTYMGDFLSPETMMYTLDSLKMNIEKEMPYHLDRYKTLTIQEWHDYIEFDKKDVILKNKAYYQYQHLNDYYGFAGLVKLNIPRPKERFDAPLMQLNNIDLLTNQFDGMYYKGQSFKLEWIGDEYEFDGWEVNITYEDEEAVTFIEANHTLEIQVEENVSSINILPLTEVYSIPPLLKDDIKIYSIPTGVRIAGIHEKSNIYIYDMTGKLIEMKNDQLKESDVHLFRKGVYIIKIVNDSFTTSRKIIY